MHPMVRSLPAPGELRVPVAFRPEIQALRAVAVVSVVLYHLWPQWFPGGFIGVDVFFVVSGFLITGNMVREAEATGRLSLSNFWANRVRRILPAGLLAIVVTAVASIWLLPLTRLASVTGHALASVFYGENWLLANEAVDYLAQTNADTPFQHFWSLGVEEQFYLVWPLVVAITLIAVTRSRFRRTLGAVFVALVVTSFVWSVVLVGRGDPTAYFATQTRLWQLGAGALLALLPTTWRLPYRARLVCAAVSIAVIAFGVWWIQPSMPFPGALALVPVLGAALLIGTGPIIGRDAGAASTESAGVLAWRPVQWLGDISYSLYLWHFPPVVIYVALVGAQPDLPSGLGLALIALVLASLSYYLVEQPVRQSRWLKRSSRRTLVAGGVAMGLAALLACTPLIPLALHRQEVAAASNAPKGAGPRGATAFDLATLPAGADPSFVNAAQAILPDPIGELALPTMPGHSYNDCQASGEQPLRECSYGPVDAAVKVVVVGDSNAAQYLPALLTLARENNWRLVQYTRSECPFTRDMRPTSATNSGCPAANAELLRKLVEEVKPDLVFAAASSSYNFGAGENGEPPGAAGFAAYWNELLDAGIRVVAVQPIPRPRRDPVECVGANLKAPIACAEPRGEAVSPKVEALYRRAGELAPGVVALNLTDQVCSPDRCFAVLGNTLVYRDKAHFSVEFVETLTGALRQVLA